MILAETAWSDTLIALGGIFLVTAIAVVIIWQVFATGRAGIMSGRDKELAKLVEEANQNRQAINAELGQTREILSDLQARMAEIERLMKEVE